MFRQQAPAETFKKNAETFRLAAEKFMQHADISDSDPTFPWQMVLFNTLGETIRAYEKEPTSSLKNVLVNALLKDIAYILSDEKYTDNAACNEFTHAINRFVVALEKPEQDDKTDFQASDTRRLI